jgi:hypothetical protein
MSHSWDDVCTCQHFRCDHSAAPGEPTYCQVTGCDCTRFEFDYDLTNEPADHGLEGYR